MKKDHRTATANAEESHRIFSDDGVDLTLIRWMLSLSPEERVKTLQNNVNAILKLRHARPKR